MNISISGKLGVFATLLCLGIGFNSGAQTTTRLTPPNPYSALQNPALSNIAGAYSTIAQILSTPVTPSFTPQISLTNTAPGGTYWSLQSPLPLPGDFFPELPVYVLDSTNRIFMIDDRGVDYAALSAQQAARNAASGFGGTFFQANDLVIDTNRLWLSVSTNAASGSNEFNVVLHETATGSYYDVLTKTDLLIPGWGVEDTVVGATGNETPVTIHRNSRTNLFVSARESIIPIITQPLAQEVASGDSVTFTVG
ncbi:MAG TPA: hypothetical protein VF988_15655, partial [Verrucomicrobiae bacterium]